MAAQGEKSFCVLEYHTSKYVVTVQRVHFVQSTQRTRLQTRPFVRGINSLRIIAAVKNIDAPMLTRVWQELEYRIAVCHVTRGAHIEHF